VIAFLSADVDERRLTEVFQVAGGYRHAAPTECVSDEVVLQMLPEPTTPLPANIDEIRDTACEPDVPPVRPVRVNLYTEEVEEHTPLCVMRPEPVNVVLLQEFYDRLPGASAGDYDHDIVEIAPINIYNDSVFTVTVISCWVYTAVFFIYVEQF